MTSSCADRPTFRPTKVPFSMHVCMHCTMRGRRPARRLRDSRQLHQCCARTEPVDSVFPVDASPATDQVSALRGSPCHHHSQCCAPTLRPGAQVEWFGYSEVGMGPSERTRLLAQVQACSDCASRLCQYGLVSTRPHRFPVRQCAEGVLEGAHHVCPPKTHTHTHTHALPTAPRPSPPPTHPHTHARTHARSHRRVRERGELRGKDGREGETHARSALGAVGAVHGDPCSARVGSRRGRFGCLAASLWTTRSSQRS